jgi:hypothetical protein
MEASKMSSSSYRITTVNLMLATIAAPLALQAFESPKLLPYRDAPSMEARLDGHCEHGPENDMPAPRYSFVPYEQSGVGSQISPFLRRTV